MIICGTLYSGLNHSLTCVGFGVSELFLIESYLDFCCYVSGPHDVKVQMKAVGICGSDVHFLKVINFDLPMPIFLF